MRAGARTRGRHFLRPDIATELVGIAAPRPGELVLDVGAGAGALTSLLLARGCRVIAIELDAALARRLRTGFPDARVLETDARIVRLPKQPFRVVANLPFAGAAAIVRHLMTGKLIRADVIVQWEAALKLRDRRDRRYEVTIVRRVPRGSFRPPPSVDAAHVRIVSRRSLPARARRRGSSGRTPASASTRGTSARSSSPRTA